MPESPQWTAKPVPRVYVLPALPEPPADPATTLRDANGDLWRLLPPLGWCRDGASDGLRGLKTWPQLLARGPLTEVLDA
jgi:hypothetical protein